MTTSKPESRAGRSFAIGEFLFTLGITALPTPIAIELKCVAAYPESHR